MHMVDQHFKHFYIFLDLYFSVACFKWKHVPGKLPALKSCSKLLGKIFVKLAWTLIYPITRLHFQLVAKF